MCKRRAARTRGAGATALVVSILGGACANTNSSTELQAIGDCSIPSDQIFDGGPGKDGIPALTDPALVGVGEPGSEYLRDDDRVIGLEVAGQAIAMPHNIGWWHEIVNLNLPGLSLAVTFCPLTGSSLALDRSAIGGGEFGVSGLLYQNNLIMYDRTTSQSLWPQMLRGARCGPRDGLQLTMHPVLDMTWAGWRSLHPETRVISSATGLDRNYRQYPYGSYDKLENRELLFPISRVDNRRPRKERVLGIPGGEKGGIAFPFLALDEGTPLRVVHATVEGEPVVVFWERERAAAAAYRSSIDGRPLAFEVRDGKIVDVETGSAWRIDGRAVEGTLTGERLDPIAEAFVAFWFAWAAFHPDTELWTGDAQAS